MKKSRILIIMLVVALFLCGCGKKDEVQLSEVDTGLLTSLAEDDNLDDSLPTEPQASDHSITKLDDSIEDFADDAAPEEADMAEIPEEEPFDEGFADEDFLADEEEDATADANFGDEFEDDAEADPLTEAAAVSTPAPAEAPKDVPLKEYKYETYTDNAMGLSISYPSHWSVETGNKTVTFVEPVSSGVPMRLALSAKTYEDDKLDTKRIKEEFTNYVSVIKDGYAKFARVGKVNTKSSFINRRAWTAQYKARDEDKQNVRGYVTMTSIDETKQIVALNFSAPPKKYTKETRSMFKNILYSVAPVMETPSEEPAA